MKSTIFAGLTSLLSLDVAVNGPLADCEKIEKIINSLNKLQDLTLISRIENETCSTYDISLLTSLRSLHLDDCNVHIAEKLANTIPVKYLYYWNDLSGSPPYEMMRHLVDLEISTRMHATIKDLRSLASPLKSLMLTFHGDVAIELDALTFESCRSWNATLQNLQLFCSSSCQDIIIEGSPFTWFPNLRILRIQGNQYGEFIIQTLSENTFNGLNNLRELYLNRLNTNVFRSRALNTFHSSQSLRVLDLSDNQMNGNIDTYQLCPISSLQELKLLHNNFGSFILDDSCALPNLQRLSLVDQASNYFVLQLHTICKTMPHLKTLDAGDITIVDMTASCTLNICRCLDLKMLDLSGTFMTYCDDCVQYKINMPQLEKLYLQHVLASQNKTVIQVLKTFEVPHLNFLDLSFNHISEIAEQDTIFFQNLTFLDLSYNELTSLTNMPYLNRIETLLLNDNKLTHIPELFFLKTHPVLFILDLNRNPILCDCSVQVLRKWLLTDTLVFLDEYERDDSYCCAKPNSLKGLSVTQVLLDCKSYLWTYISISLSCVVVIVITTIFLVKHRWHIQYKLFLLLNRRRAVQNYPVDDIGDDDDENGMPRYDAYVTYHRQDEDWVDGQLLANIEEGDEPFRLCLRTRNIRAGRLIFNELSLHIQRSRKILVILSPRFVENNWCYFELNMAHHRVLEENSSVLIFVILEDIPNRKLTLLLRQLFCKAQCFKWPGDRYGQNVFWQRLREELKRPVPLDRRFNI